MEKYRSFGDAEYWEARYDPNVTDVPNPNDGLVASSYDWYEEYSAEPSSPLRNIIRAHAPPSISMCCLDIGCGDSNLCQAMSADGFAMVATDIALSAGSAQSGVAFVQADGQRLPFRADSFECAIDKGTIDAMLCAAATPSSGNRVAALRLLTEAARVVRAGGWFMSISYSSPQERVPLLLEGLTTCGGVRAHRVPIGTRNGYNGCRAHHIYACRLGADLPPAAAAGSDDDALLQRACLEHDEAQVTALLDRGASAVSTACNLQGTTPAMLAAGVGARGCLAALVAAAGAEHTRRSADLLGHTALHHSAMAGQEGTLAMLLALHLEEPAELPRNAEGSTASMHKHAGLKHADWPRAQGVLLPACHLLALL